MAFVIANELGVNLKQTSGPVIEKAGDLEAILNDLEPGMSSLSMRSTVFLCQSKKCFTAPWKILHRHYGLALVRAAGGPSDLPPFTLIGATTRVGMLSNPFARSLWDYRTHGIL